MSALVHRSLFITVITLMAVSSTGCGWLKKKFTSEAPYQDAQTSRPLEAPPGLDLPKTSGTYLLPSAAGVSGAAVTSAPPAADAPASQGETVSEVVLADTLENAYKRLGLALGRIDGVTIAAQAQLLNSYEVNYQGNTLLIRAEKAGDSVRIAAVGSDGQALIAGPAAALLALLKARLN